jgi:hypothetical protein
MKKLSVHHSVEAHASGKPVLAEWPPAAPSAPKAWPSGPKSARVPSIHKPTKIWRRDPFPF